MNQDAEHTLPGVAALVEDAYKQPELMLTVLFHPDAGRIGQWARVPRKTSTTTWVLGRHYPRFEGGDGAGGPLADGHISREAVHFSYSRQTLRLRRPAGSSRCRVARGELRDTLELSADELQRGVPIMLSHNTVLLLKLALPPPQEPVVASSVAPLLGRSSAMADLRQRVLQAAPSSLDVLIRGETGSGKELVARALHNASARAGAALVSVNMSAIPVELASAALFGSARGAFTGADKARPGYFQQANGGSLFLDEIGDTPALIQAQLLRALQQREIQPVGGKIATVDVRVISATDLQLDGAASTFKGALRHRLGACEILVPPLREHPEDIGELLLHFLREAATQAHCVDKLPGETADELQIAAWANVFFRFARYDWPGNVRQLRNYAQQVILNMQGLPALTDLMVKSMEGTSPSASCDLRRSQARDTGGVQPVAGAGSAADAAQGPSRVRMRDVPQSRFDQCMRDSGYEIQRVAQQLGVSRASVYRRIQASASYRLATEIGDVELRAVLRRNNGSLEAAARELRVSLASLRKSASARGLTEQ